MSNKINKKVFLKVTLNYIQEILFTFWAIFEQIYIYNLRVLWNMHISYLSVAVIFIAAKLKTIIKWNLFSLNTIDT